MKRKLQIIISASAASVLAFSVLAQNPPDRISTQSTPTRNRMSGERSQDRLNDAAKASDVIGMTVNNYQDEKLGKVEDLAVDVESGRIVQVILSTGGLLGIGDTLVAVPPGALHRDPEQKTLHLDANKEKLKGAPIYESTPRTEGSDSNRLYSVYRYYGEESSFRFIQTGDAVPEVQRNTNASPNAVSSTREARAAWDKDRTSSPSQSMIPVSRTSSPSQSMIPVSRLGQLQKVSKVMGTPVMNLQHDKLGKVENLLLDLPSGRIVAVVVSSGGFLGVGDELSAVPPTALRYSTDRENLRLDASKEMLGNAPHFKSDQWPDFAQPGYANGVYRAYQVEPYFTTNVTKEADNTARNARDRDDRTLTPLDQGNSKADVATTAQIRKEIIAVENISVNARNVKIITVNGRVTLRGSVNTAEEKRLIGEIADRVARDGNVDNQLEVKLTTTSSINP